MGSDPERSVVNAHAESHDVRRLFVGDSSVIPTTLSVNPSLTIMSLASRLAAYLAAVGLAGSWAGVELIAPDGPGHLTTLPAVTLGYALASALGSPLAAAYSRRRERAADRYALELTGEGETYALAFERLAEQNLSELDPPRLYHLLTGSHPALRERIETARGWQE